MSITTLKWEFTFNGIVCRRWHSDEKLFYDHYYWRVTTTHPGDKELYSSQIMYVSSLVNTLVVRHHTS